MRESDFNSIDELGLASDESARSEERARWVGEERMGEEGVHCHLRLNCGQLTYLMAAANHGDLALDTCRVQHVVVVHVLLQFLVSLIRAAL